MKRQRGGWCRGNDSAAKRPLPAGASGASTQWRSHTTPSEAARGVVWRSHRAASVAGKKAGPENEASKNKRNSAGFANRVR